jgi:hypothetical protein
LNWIGSCRFCSVVRQVGELGQGGRSCSASLCSARLCFSSAFAFAFSRCLALPCLALARLSALSSSPQVGELGQGGRSCSASLCSARLCFSSPLIAAARVSLLGSSQRCGLLFLLRSALLARLAHLDSALNCAALLFSASICSPHTLLDLPLLGSARLCSDLLYDTVLCCSRLRAAGQLSMALLVGIAWLG